MIKLISGVVVLLMVAVVAIGQPREFRDPMTGGRDGGWMATWGSVTCAVWTWSEPQVHNTYAVPLNCSRT